MLIGREFNHDVKLICTTVPFRSCLCALLEMLACDAALCKCCLNSKSLSKVHHMRKAAAELPIVQQDRSRIHDQDGGQGGNASAAHGGVNAL